MAKTVKQTKPSIRLATAIEELILVNQKLFELKQGTKALLDAIYGANPNIPFLKKIVEIHNLPEVIKDIEIE